MPRNVMHPNFQKKNVMQLDCRFCGNAVCNRAMKAILLADTKTELFSTDSPPTESVDLVFESYCTEKCFCNVRDVACLTCGNVVGYAVVQPCEKCTRSCNNGHVWMFFSHTVDAMERLDRTGDELLVWGKLIEEDAMPSEEEECIR